MDRRKRCIPVLLGTCVSILAAGCGHGPVPAQAPITRALPPPPIPVAVDNPPPTPPLPPPGPFPILIRDAGLQTPESVLWDAEQDVYFVSNINGDPSAPDKNGFISKIGPDGRVIDLKFVDGSKPGSELNAPKGLAIIGGILYVADLNVVRKFDRKTGKARGKIKVEKSVFLNDLAASPSDKTLYVSDSAVTTAAGNFAGTGDDAIYAIDIKRGSATTLIKDKALHWPNGLLADEEGVWVVTLGANELFHVDRNGDTGPVTRLPKGGLDGIVRLDDGSFLISSWDASAIYRGLPGKEFKEFISGIPSPADIGFDGKRNTLLVPIFTQSAIQLVPLLPAAQPAPASPPLPPGSAGKTQQSPANAQPASPTATWPQPPAPTGPAVPAAPAWPAAAPAPSTLPSPPPAPAAAPSAPAWPATPTPAPAAPPAWPGALPLR